MAKQLPSEEQIISLLKDEPMVGSRLRAALGLPKKQKMEFKQLLAQMVDQGVLKRNNHKEYLIGDGESQEEKRNNRLKKIDEQGSDNRRPGARSRRQKEDTSVRVRRGILHQVGEEDWVVTDTNTGEEFAMCHRKQAPGKEGAAISFTLYPHPKHKHDFLAKVDHSADNLNMSWKEVSTQFMKDSNLPEDFSPAIKKYVRGLKPPTGKDFKGRVDYRPTSIVCIDPVGAMDHDDAISIERTEKGYKLGVHIADVSYYVTEGSELDEEALERSYTQYLPWTAVPMIPDELSSDLCSLHQDKDRCAFTCMIELDQNANVVQWDFHRSIVRITRSLTYGEALELFNQGDKEIALLAEVTEKLKAVRTKEGLLEFKSTEFGCKFNEQGEPVEIVPRTTDISNSWVEECMLIANNCCAKELKARKLQGIYRIHEAPDTKDVMELYYMFPDLFKDAPVLLRDLGKPRSGDTNLNPTLFHLYEHLVKRAGDDEVLTNRILRSMQKAHYDSNSFGHFALNWQDYSHFTSPIRRYADLWCHRELARTGKDITAPRDNNLIEVCDLISGNEIKNMKVERIAVKVCACFILRDRIGDDFEAKISGVEEWGIFVSLKDPIAEGLVRFRDISYDDYFIFNPDQQMVIGKKCGKSFRRGDEVKVRLLRVNPLRGECDFAILEKLTPEVKKKRKDSAQERMDRAAAAEALGMLTQPDEDDYPTKRSRDRRRSADMGERGRRTEKRSERKSSRGSSPKAYGEKLSRKGKGRRR
ncbi:MAG: VacB/RNase II family 3'-5' exoribonuclease [Fibrobacteraceae bacterium]|nr:VacB/RNase II family 3'-5' exoribonuclease [Fibrobacteraceae bacterium]